MTARGPAVVGETWKVHGRDDQLIVVTGDPDPAGYFTAQRIWIVTRQPDGEEFLTTLDELTVLATGQP